MTRINILDDFIQSPLAVVCHDAGATHLIVHWLEKYNNNIFACMEGPARNIWNSKFPNTRLRNVLENRKMLSSLSLIKATAPGKNPSLPSKKPNSL